jgi:N utilization substance protein A
MKGTRVQNIIQELKGEKIDIVNWNEDITRFAANALAPAEISRIFMDEVNRELEVVVPDNHLSLAIGRRGQNVKLASKLTGWKIDILSESQVAARTAEAIYNLMMLPGMNETMAQSIFQSGFSSFKEISEAQVEDLQTIPGFEEKEKAQKLLQDAQALVNKYKTEGIPVPTLQAVNEAARGGAQGNAKTQADQRLKEELEKLKDEESGQSEQ